MRPLRVDPVLASAFRVEWLVDVTPNERDDLERAVAEKAGVVLRAARYAAKTLRELDTEVEVKVWLDTGLTSAYVAVFVEPRLAKTYFLVMDASGKDRLACVVFDRVASVTGEEARAESGAFMAAAERLLAGPPLDRMDFIAAIRSEFAREGSRAGAQ